MRLGPDQEAKASLTSGFDVTASYAYMDSEVTSSNTTVTAKRGIVGVPATSRSERGTVPIAVSRHTASLWGNYTFQEGSPARG